MDGGLLSCSVKVSQLKVVRCKVVTERTFFFFKFQTFFSFTKNTAVTAFEILHWRCTNNFLFFYVFKLHNIFFVSKIYTVVSKTFY